MAGTWLVDGNRIATKIRSASDPKRATWKSNPTRSCPNCLHVIDNSDVNQEWPGLPRGVKFDPSDQEIIWHLLTKVGVEDSKPHPFINEFIPTIENDDGICYTHPQKLPGVKEDGSVSHFFHRAIKAYNTGTRKRRKIHGDDFGDVRWHKTGRTKPVLLDGVQRGCKKIMVLYMTMAKGGKAEKTNWVMHQYHLGTEEDEKDGEYVISKIFHQQQQQQQQTKQADKTEQDVPETTDRMIVKVDPVTPKSVTPDPPRTGRQCHEYDQVQDYTVSCINPPAQDFSEKHPPMQYVEDEVQAECENSSHDDLPAQENHVNQMLDNDDNNDNDDHAEEDSKWWDGESQFLLDSQQLVEGLSLCDELLQSQSPQRDANGNDGMLDGKPRLSDYAQLGAEHLKKDLEECQNLEGDDPTNIELDTPPEFRLSQLDFASQDSYIAWGWSKGN
ncbi:Arabidopsis NAC domain containing protein 8, SUPPRESSOR OF GAMMA RADIATION 1 [Hibiscus trionum]|uniref:Arabidopsis NAC domain containing protein 8, SUPPRESSOR OF GAMMA RADIATION 1 n=1 Tax=Hibiscus trionum TaxID=183268 RepID=A0A9W7IRQ8_HIBTR|nr:Arabidopsis NAC domain containing protein 8, SUPPRESSOR OF GAMMA RADIATION 1 [Hibiscus trionum]